MSKPPPTKYQVIAACAIAVSLIIIIAMQKNPKLSKKSAISKTGKVNVALVNKNLQSLPPTEGVTLPVKWNDLGERMISAGIIDEQKLNDLYKKRGGLTNEEKKLLYQSDNPTIKISLSNANFILNVLWGLGIANKNDILDSGPMNDPANGGAANFASTGGWTLGKNNSMEYYSKYNLISLTKQQQQLVERVSKNIYRPCCDNSTYFPDCNHGMAMLGLLEMMASQNINEKDMYKFALEVNYYWFPGTYRTAAKYLAYKKSSWDKTDPKLILGNTYSSASGSSNILSSIDPGDKNRNPGCSV